MVSVKTYTLLMSALKQSGVASVTAIMGAVNDCMPLILLSILLFGSGLKAVIKALYMLIFK